MRHLRRTFLVRPVDARRRAVSSKVRRQAEETLATTFRALSYPETVKMSHTRQEIFEPLAALPEGEATFVHFEALVEVCVSLLHHELGVVWGPPNQSDVMDRDELSEIHFEWARNMRKVVGDKALPRMTVSVCGAFACKTRHFASFAFQCLGMCRERGGGGC